jgi:hypothetical protein
MARTRKGAGARSKSQAEKSQSSEIKRLNKRARDLLSKAGKSVKDVRHEVSLLKRAGIVASRINARSYVPTRYMLRKLEDNRDILSGEVIAVKAPKSVRQKYREKGIYEERGNALIVPREYANQRTRIQRGLVEISRSLRMGEEVRLVLPFKATDMETVAHKLMDDPTLDGMKREDELFGFRLFGHNMNTIGFPSSEDMANYILTHYAHLFSGKSGREGVKHFELFRFKANDSQLSEPPESGKRYTPRKHPNRERDFFVNKRLQRDAARKAKQREKETPEDRQRRLDEQRERSRRNRQEKFRRRIERDSGLE